jgi:hypothetical protein
MALQAWAADDGAHAEDAFIAELVAGIGWRCADRTERRLLRALAADLLDLNPELAYPWGTLELESWLHAPVPLVQRRGVASARAGVLRRAVLGWLAKTKRIEPRAARLMCRNVGEQETPRAAMAA